MVAACSANRAPDRSVTPITSELGSLLLGYRSIIDPRWRLRAVVALVPVCTQFRISLDGVHDELRRGVRLARCPAFWRARVTSLLEQHIAHPSVAGLMRLVDALFTREWRACGTTAIGAMLALGDVAEAERLTTGAGERRYTEDVALPLLRTGNIDGAFVGNVDAPDSERAYRPSWLLVRACVDAIVRQRQRDRVSDAERIACSLPRPERAIAEAHLARLTLAFESPAAALTRVRTIRERSVRSGALVLLTRSTDDLGAKRVFAASIETRLLRQAATLEIVRALYRQGLHRHACRALQHVDDPRLAAERMLLGAELRVTRWRTDEAGVLVEARALRDAERGPAWTHVEPILELTAVDDLLRAVVLLRSGMRRHDDVVLGRAAGLVRPHAFCPSSRRYFVDLTRRAGVDRERALLSLQDDRNSAALDALRAESIAITAESLADRPLSDAMALGLAGGAIAIGDARSSERAQYDEGLALSPAAATRRRVLITTAQTCLRGALANPDDWSVDVVAARLRTLAHLGGGLAVDAIRKALVTLPMHATLTPLAFDALCKLDAAAAASFVLERVGELHAAHVDLAHLFQLLEQYAASPRGMWRIVAAAARALAKHGIAPELWLAELFVLMRDRVDALVRVLRAVPAYSPIPSTPHALLAELDDVPLRLVARNHSTIAQLLANDASLLEALLVARPASVDPKLKRWSTDQWRGLLRKAVDYAAVHEPLVERFVRKVGRRHWYDALRTANVARLRLVGTTAFEVSGTRYRLRLLDKRLDILTCLRFADVPARSCFRTDSGYWRPGDTIEAWKDPLTLCCHVERGESAQPCGFWFGSFAVVDDQPALVMNSLHVRPNDGALRQQIVHAFERAVCEPLAISHIGIANVHGGKGELPASYIKRPVTILRYRALAQDGWSLDETYDDICGRLCEPVVVERLFWRS